MDYGIPIHAKLNEMKVPTSSHTAHTHLKTKQYKEKTPAWVLFLFQMPTDLHCWGCSCVFLAACARFLVRCDEDKGCQADDDIDRRFEPWDRAEYLIDQIPASAKPHAKANETPIQSSDSDKDE